MLPLVGSEFADDSITKDERLPRLVVNLLLAGLLKCAGQQKLKTGGELQLTGVTTVESPKKGYKY